VFLYDPRLDVAHPLDIRTPRRSRDFAGPSATVVTAPSGAPAVVVTLYLPSSGAAVGESGELVYYRDLDRATTASSRRGRHASRALPHAC
jgi:hypothetical protein